MKIKAVATRLKDLKPGDLFSNAGQEYWDTIKDQEIGTSVFIRSEKPTPEDDDAIALAPVYKVTITKPRAKNTRKAKKSDTSGPIL